MERTVSIKEDNLRAINQYYLTTREQRAIHFLEHTTDTQRARTLQSHLLREPSRDALDRRDDLDYLLRYYSVLELALLTHAVTDLPEVTKERAKRHLNDRAVRRYYEWYYPLLLPSLLRARLDGHALRSSVGDHTDAFLAFVSLDASRDDEDTEMFLAFLDDYHIEIDDTEHDLGTVMRTIAAPAKLLAALSVDDDDETPTDQGVRGFLQFISFSRSLQGLLDATSDAVVRSAFWHRHGYWYEQLSGPVLGVLLTGIQALSEHVEADDSDLSRRTHEDMQRAAITLRALTSSIYRIDVERIVFGSAQAASGKE